MDHTSASDYREGKDIQGIPWERLNYSRNQYREMRLKEYKNYQSLTRSRSRPQVRALSFCFIIAFAVLLTQLTFGYTIPDMFVLFMKECKQVERKDTFFDFHSSTRAVKSTIVHFQVQFYLDISFRYLHIKLLLA